MSDAPLKRRGPITLLRERRWLRWAFALALVSSYPLSYGPSIWVYRHTSMPHRAMNWMEQFYWPMTWLYHHGPGVIGMAVRWWVSVWQ